MSETKDTKNTKDSKDTKSNIIPAIIIGLAIVFAASSIGRAINQADFNNRSQLREISSRMAELSLQISELSSHISELLNQTTQ